MLSIFWSIAFVAHIAADFGGIVNHGGPSAVSTFCPFSLAHRPSSIGDPNLAFVAPAGYIYYILDSHGMSPH